MAQKVHQLSLEYNVNENLVDKIIGCESGWDKASINYNSNGTVDKGLWQINSIHSSEMKRLGLDINNWEDSLTFGFMLLQNGTHYWNASRSCWSG